jgi:hypothetical protein
MLIQYFRGERDRWSVVNVPARRRRASSASARAHPPGQRAHRAHQPRQGLAGHRGARRDRGRGSHDASRQRIATRACPTVDKSDTRILTLRRRSSVRMCNPEVNRCRLVCGAVASRDSRVHHEVGFQAKEKLAEFEAAWFNSGRFRVTNGVCWSNDLRLRQRQKTTEFSRIPLPGPRQPCDRLLTQAFGAARRNLTRSADSILFHPSQ